VKKVKKKIKIYDPDKKNSFVMQFGFEQPMPIKYKTKRI
jgi:hypothetical protein